MIPWTRNVKSYDAVNSLIGFVCSTMREKVSCPVFWAWRKSVHWIQKFVVIQLCKVTLADSIKSVPCRGRAGCFANTKNLETTHHSISVVKQITKIVCRIWCNSIHLPEFFHVNIYLISSYWVMFWKLIGILVNFIENKCLIHQTICCTCMYNCCILTHQNASVLKLVVINPRNKFELIGDIHYRNGWR